MKLFCGIAISTLLLTPALRSQGGQVDPRAQQQADAQLAAPKLDPRPVVSVDLTATPLRAVLDAIAKAAPAPIVLQFDPAVTNLKVPVTVKLSNVTGDEALHGALDTHGLTFKVTDARAVLIYPDTPASRAKYTESIRTFTIAHANVMMLMQTVNQALAGTTFTLRPVMVTNGDGRTITVRATADTMAEIAKLIAANDK